MASDQEVCTVGDNGFYPMTWRNSEKADLGAGFGEQMRNSGCFRPDFPKYGEAICGFGKIEMFLGDFRGIAGRVLKAGKRFSGMRRKGFKGRIEKRMIGKCNLLPFPRSVQDGFEELY